MGFSLPKNGEQIISVKGRNTGVIYLHPFIEEFSHRIAPAINKAKFGASNIPVTTLVGISEVTYTLRIALVASDKETAKTNFETAQKLKTIVEPQIGKIGSAGGVTLNIRTLSNGPINGVMIACEENIDLPAGFIFSGKQMYPKLTRLTMTVVQDVARKNAEEQDPGNAGRNTVLLSPEELAKKKVAPAGSTNPTKKKKGTSPTIASSKQNSNDVKVLTVPDKPAPKPNHRCPKGKQWSTSKQKCVPFGSE
jgi:hypothetical protein